MRKSSSYAELMPQQRKTSNSQLSSSISSSKYIIPHLDLLSITVPSPLMALDQPKDFLLEVHPEIV